MLNLKRYHKLLPVLGLVAALSFLSCDRNFIFDYEGDCDVTYKVNFKYDLNLKWANAFTNEVKSVRLYAFDENDVLVKEIDRNDAELQNDDFSIILDLNPGKYQLLAWCGVDNPEAKKEHFAIPEAIEGETTLQEVTCMLNRYEDEVGNIISDDRLEFMFHGRLDVDLPESLNGGEFLYTIPLTKDTNHIRVVLQHLSGEDVDVSRFNFRIEEANGFYANDNSLIEDDLITYKTYSKSQGEATIVKNGTRDSMKSKTAIADLSVARLLAHRNQNMMLTVTNDRGEDIARIPVIDYALLTKDYYEEAFSREMSDQEFLDREDEYIMTLFLDENYTWYSAEIYINSWRVVFSEYDVN